MFGDGALGAVLFVVCFLGGIIAAIVALMWLVERLRFPAVMTWNFSVAWTFCWLAVVLFLGLHELLFPEGPIAMALVIAAFVAGGLMVILTILRMRGGDDETEDSVESRSGLSLAAEFPNPRYEGEISGAAVALTDINGGGLPATFHFNASMTVPVPSVVLAAQRGSAADLLAMHELILPPLNVVPGWSNDWSFRGRPHQAAESALHVLPLPEGEAGSCLVKLALSDGRLTLTFLLGSSDRVWLEKCAELAVRYAAALSSS